MGKKSRNKGKRGERELAKALESILDIDARRGRQFSGSPESPDVITSLPNIHFECKRVEKFRLYPSLKQAINDAGKEQIPVVVHRKNYEDWVVVVRLQDLPELCKTINEQIN